MAKFNSGQQIRFINLGNESLLNGQTGEVMGVSFDHPELTHFIVKLDIPMESEYESFEGMIYAIQITEHCLEKI